MKQLKGLNQKEWMLMRFWLVVLFILNTLGIVGIPLLLNAWIDDVPIFKTAIILAGIWLLFSHLIAAILFITSLQLDMKRPDIWLHTESSIYKLIGTKLAFATIITSLSLLWIELLLVILQIFYADPEFMTFGQLLEIKVYVFVGIFFSIILNLIIVLFFWVIYHLIRPYVKGFSVIITFFLYIVSSIIWSTNSSLEFIKNFPRFGGITIPVPGFIEKFSMNENYRDLTFLIEPTIYLSDIVIITAFAIILFWGAALWFEKKVRI
ncbi:hypothetical protein [Psychrobacillus sp. OK032]|uniref:hypothetical protein n=1 Tax=Psychrobacillus sp. OK032 TaxID=1884358 RepID=UPI0008C39085|nr:hypothetical protein [Psychrobacillus sp. OK032]SER79544.1 hypothetical protein SAMN05518872_10275 [Psychrobacillus sp. OK032]